MFLNRPSLWTEDRGTVNVLLCEYRNFLFSLSSLCQVDLVCVSLAELSVCVWTAPPCGHLSITTKPKCPPPGQCFGVFHESNLMQFSGSFLQSTSQRKRSQAIHPMGGVLASPSSRATVSETRTRSWVTTSVLILEGGPVNSWLRGCDLLYIRLFCSDRVYILTLSWRTAFICASCFTVCC